MPEANSSSGIAAEGFEHLSGPPTLCRYVQRDLYSFPPPSVTETYRNWMMYSMRRRPQLRDTSGHQFNASSTKLRCCPDRCRDHPSVCNPHASQGGSRARALPVPDFEETSNGRIVMVEQDRSLPFAGYHFLDASQRRLSLLFALVVDALRHRDGQRPRH